MIAVSCYANHKQQAVPLGIIAAAVVVASVVGWVAGAWLRGGTANGTEEFGTGGSWLQLEAFLGRVAACKTLGIGLEMAGGGDETCGGFWNSICFAGETSGTVTFLGAKIGASGLQATGAELGGDPLLAKNMSSWACGNEKCQSSCLKVKQVSIKMQNLSRKSIFPKKVTRDYTFSTETLSNTLTEPA